MTSSGPTIRSPQLSLSSSGQIEIIGLDRKLFSDLYHVLLTTSWPRFFGVVLASHLLANSVFALLYLAAGDGGVVGMRPGHFGDAFFFSVQTMATIGYGVMAPRTVAAHLLVTLQAFLGLLLAAMATGLMFAKFARPTARVLFSNVAVVGVRDGVPSFMVRMANARTNQIVEAQLHVVLLRDETTIEGERLRRMYDLQLIRKQTAVFALTWTAVHPITPDSPLYGQTHETLARSGATIMVSLIGLDDTFGQSVHTRQRYEHDQIVWNARFADIMGFTETGKRKIDYSNFHNVLPMPQSDGLLAASEATAG